MERDDLRLLAQDHSTNIQTVERLAELGVHEDDLDDVLGFRDALSAPGHKESGVLPAVVSAQAIANAYKAAEGDLDLLELLVLRADARAGAIYEQLYKLGLEGKPANAARFTRALNEVVGEYQEQGSGYLAD